MNPLEADGERAFNHGRRERSPWFETACCPTNLARLVPQVPGMLYATDAEGLAVTMYAASRTRVELAGVPTRVAQRTGYPFDGRVEIEVDPERAVTFALRLRIPTWCGERFAPGALYGFTDAAREPVTIRVNDAAVDPPRRAGFAVLAREWRAGDRVVIDLPMPVRASRCDERVAANRGRVALTRGPLVLVAEEVDHGIAAQRLCFDGAPPVDVAAVARRELAAGHATVVVSLPGCALPLGRELAERTLTSVPYYAWNNRGAGSMATWIPTDPALLPTRVPGLANESFASIRATHTWGGDTVTALADGRLPTSSSDTSIPRWTSWPQRGRAQQVEIRFDRPRRLQGVGLYFYDDAGGVRLPRAWRVEVEVDGKWSPLQLRAGDAYAVAADRFQVVRPGAPVVPTALRIQLDAAPDAAVGLLEADIRLGRGR